MMNSKEGMIIGGLSFLTGLLIGGAVGVLYAPQSGARTRRRIQDFAEDMRERIEEMAEEANGTVSKMVDEGRRFVGR